MAIPVLVSGQFLPSTAPGIVIGHGQVLLLSIAKWCNLLTSQLLVYDGDRQAPPDLLNLLPEGTDLDPDTWLMRRMLTLAFLHRIANAPIIQQKIFLKELVHIYRSNGTWMFPNFIRTYTLYVDSGTGEKFHPSWRSPNLERYGCTYYIA
jgi:hypothetical protein